MTSRVIRRATSAIVVTAVSVLVAAMAPSAAHAHHTGGIYDPIKSIMGNVLTRYASASHTVDPLSDSGDYATNPSGEPIVITRTSAGTYRVRLPGIGYWVNEVNHGGVVHVVPYTSSSYLCTVGHWQIVTGSSSYGPDLEVAVYCYNSTGARQDSRFMLNFTAASNGLSTVEASYLWANQQLSSSYVPASFWRWDATGGAATVTRTGVGHYEVFMPAAADRYPSEAVYQATAYSTSPVYCKTYRPFALPGYLTTGVINVRCFSYNGAPVDSQFTLSYGVDPLLAGHKGLGWASAFIQASSGGASVVWEEFSGHPPDYRFAFDVTRLGTGRYQISTNYGGQGHGVAYASTIGDVRCVVSASAVGVSFSILSVRCYAASGALADTSLYVALQ